MILTYNEGNRLRVIPGVREIRTSGTCLTIITEDEFEPRVISRDAEFIIEEDKNDSSGTLCVGDGESNGGSRHLYQE